MPKSGITVMTKNLKAFWEIINNQEPSQFIAAYSVIPSMLFAAAVHMIYRQKFIASFPAARALTAVTVNNQPSSLKSRLSMPLFLLAILVGVVFSPLLSVSKHSRSIPIGISLLIFAGLSQSYRAVRRIAVVVSSYLLICAGAAIIAVSPPVTDVACELSQRLSLFAQTALFARIKSIHVVQASILKGVARLVRGLDAPVRAV